jgi:hypothetical protein
MLMNQPSAPASKQHTVKINQQPKRASRQPQICQQNGVMNRRKILDGLKLDDHTAINQKINAITAIELHISVDQRKRLLTLKRN